MPYKNIPENQEKIRKARREWYYRNKEKQKRYRDQRTKEIRLWYTELKSGLKCNRCPEDHIATLQFHHIDPSQKDAVLARVVSNGWSKKKILKEIEKCEILCANCHAKEHHRS